MQQLIMSIKWRLVTELVVLDYSAVAMNMSYSVFQFTLFHSI